LSGQQIIGQAIGGYTEKLKFGHHGINQPVKIYAPGALNNFTKSRIVVVPASVKALPLTLILI